VKISKTALAASASVAAVLLAGTAALAANIGVLGASGTAAELSVTPTIIAAAPATTTTTSSATVASSVPLSPVDSSTTTVAPSETSYQVAGIGVVTLAHTAELLSVSSVDVGSEWDWTVERRGSTQLTIEFNSPDSQITFLAQLDAGQVLVEVLDTTPVSTTIGTTPDASTTTTVDDSTTTTVDDDDDSGDSDNSGSGSSNSGSGGGDDDSDDDDPSYDD